MKRENYISWDEYFMGIAKLSAMRSKDPHTQVGACIVNDQNKIVGIGYNGFPRGVSDDNFPWEKTTDYKNSKYAYVCHAELNAILNSGCDLSGCSLYVTLFPCNECAKAIIQSGITTIYYLEDKNFESDSELASKRMLKAVGIKLKKITVKELTI